MSENNRRARFYRLTAAGRRQVKKETRDWETAITILAKFLEMRGAE
jgi:DNA-binding MarR family transcriptional regulator